MHKNNLKTKYLKSFALLIFSFVFQLNGQSVLTTLSDIDLPQSSKNLFYIQTSTEYRLYDPFKPIAEEKLKQYLDFYQWENFEIQSSAPTTYRSGVSSPQYPINITYIKNLWLDKNSAPDTYFRFIKKEKFSEDQININYLLPPHTWNLNDCNENCFAKPFNETVWVANSYESIVRVFDPDFDIEKDWGLTKNITVNKTSNCFGTAKTVYLPEHGFSFEDPNSFQKILNENFEMILPGEKVRFGDFMTIYIKRNPSENDDSLSLIHAATVISRDYVWGRPSAHPDDKWGFEPITAAYHSQNAQLRGLFEVSSSPWEVRDFFNRYRFIFWRIKADC